MEENRLWLYEENETEFKVNEDKLKVKLEQILENKKAIDNIIEEKGFPVKEAKRFEIMGGISSLLLENKDAREHMPPFGQISEDNFKIMTSFIQANERLDAMLEKEGYLYPDMLPLLHRVLVGYDENISDRDKGRFRDAGSDLIQMGYFIPTKGKDVKIETSLAFSKYCILDNKHLGRGGVLSNIINTAKIHAQLVRIQPFLDGNKRIAFLTVNGMLKLGGLLPVTLCETGAEQKQYSAALKTAIVGRDVTPLAEHIMDSELKRQQSILDSHTINVIGNKLLLSREDLNK